MACAADSHPKTAKTRRYYARTDATTNATTESHAEPIGTI